MSPHFNCHLAILINFYLLEKGIGCSGGGRTYTATRVSDWRESNRRVQDPRDRLRG